MRGENQSQGSRPSGAASSPTGGAQQAGTAVRRRAGNPLRVLAAEPEGDASGELAAALAAIGPGFQVELHRGAGSAGAGLRGAHADLVVLDAGLGEGLEPLLQQARRSATPVIVVLRESDDAQALRAYRAGAWSCVEPGPGLRQRLSAVLSEARGWLPGSRRDREEGGRSSRSLEAYSSHIIQALSSALLVVDRHGDVAFANPAAEELLGAGPGALRAQPLARWFPQLPVSEFPPLQTLRDGRRIRGAELMLNRPDGSTLSIGLSCSPLRDRAGDLDGALVVFQDLTEVKQLERQMLQAEKMASIGQLAAGVAHEINNPMGFIHANLCQLAEYLEDLQRVWEAVEELREAASRERLDTDEVRRAAESLARVRAETDAGFLLADFGTAIRESLEGTARIREIVRDLRGFSHQDTGRRTPTDVNRALDSTAHIVWTMMKHTVVLTRHYEELPPVACYPVQLQQVFMNLLMNAYQAIEERAASEELRGEIRLRTRLDGDYVVVEVGDNGIGMDAATMARIFDPFFTTKEVGVGMGLGLSTAYSLVEQQGGELRVSSEPRQGATFTLRLPLEPPHGGSW